MGAKAKTTDPEAIREAMLRDMPIEEMTDMMNKMQSRSDEMYDRSRDMMDPDSEISQRLQANIMGQNQDMIATQMRMASQNAARGGMAGSGIAAQQQASIGLQGQQQGLMAVQTGLNQQMQQAQGLLGQSTGMMGQAQSALGMQATAIGGANAAFTQTMHQNTANRQAASNANAQMAGQIIGGMFSGMSDRKVKENVKKVGVNSQGYNVYKFRYIEPYQNKLDNTVHIGVMADEIPEHLTLKYNGITRVDYSKIDLGGFI